MSRLATMDTSTDAEGDSITTILVRNLHCSSCVHTIREALSAISPSPTTVHISIVSQSVIAHHPKELSLAAMESALVGAGFDVLTSPPLSADNIPRSIPGEVNGSLAEKRKKHIRQCSLCQEEEIQSDYDSKSALGQLYVGPKTLGSGADVSDLRVEEENVTATDQKSPIVPSTDTHDVGPFRVTLSIGGMTCSSCSGTITMMVSGLQGVSEVAVSLLSNSATVIVDHKKLIEIVVNTVEDCGFEVDVMNVMQLNALGEDSASGPRTIALHIDGMFCR